MINDEELKRFHDWLQAKGDDPSITLALRWIADFEVHADEDEEDFRGLKVFAKRRARHDPSAAALLRTMARFEETAEPHTRLRRFHDWLMAKGNDPTAVLTQWWLAEFDEEQDDRTTRLKPTLH